MTDPRNPCVENGCGLCGDDPVAHPNQPYGIEVYTSDGVFIKEMHIPDAGTVVLQHSHQYDHVSLLATGSVRAWADGVEIGDYVAPKGIEIKAGVKHTFLSLEDETVIYCIHNVARQGDVQILEEHHIVKGEV